jgi:hypothetical protein
MNNRLANEQKAVYKYDWDFGQLGALSGMFLATPARVKAAIGRSFDFGAVFGPRTYATGTIGPRDIELVSDDPADIAVSERLIGKDDICGLNPLMYWEDDWQSSSADVEHCSPHV